MSRSRAPFTHFVYWRYRNETSGRILTGWCDQPKGYRSEKSAQMAVRDKNAYYTSSDMGNFMQHVYLEAGAHPRTAWKDES